MVKYLIVEYEKAAGISHYNKKILYEVASIRKAKQLLKKLRSKEYSKKYKYFIYTKH